MAYDDRDYWKGDSPDHMNGRDGDMFYRTLRVLNYAFPIGRYFGTFIRVHILFVVFLVLYLLTQGDPLWTLRWMGVLFGSVLLHEFGHVLACRSVGGEADEILMWPLGGLAFCRAPHMPMAEFITVICGPAVNAVICTICYITLVALHGADAGVSLNPLWLYNGWFKGEGLLYGWAGLVQDIYVVNYFLLLFNVLLVFYPFDGGRLVQVAIWSRTDYPTSMRWSIPVGMVGAVLIALGGLVFNNATLVVVAIFGFLACYQQSMWIRQAAEYEGWDEDWRRGQTRSAESRKNWLQLRRERKLQARIQRDREKAERFEKEVDRILAKVSQTGMKSLSSAERRTLETKTQRERGGY